MIVELGLKALHEPGVIRGRRQLRKHGIAWIMGGAKGDIQGGAARNPIKGEGEPFGSLCTQVKRSELVVVITSLSRFFYFKSQRDPGSAHTDDQELNGVSTVWYARLSLDDWQWYLPTGRVELYRHC